MAKDTKKTPKTAPRKAATAEPMQSQQALTQHAAPDNTPGTSKQPAAGSNTAPQQDQSLAVSQHKQRRAEAKPLFRPFRALGYITDSVPFSVQRRGKETYVTVSVGRAWQVYNTNKLTLVLVGPQFPAPIRALATKADLTFAAVGNVIVECKRVHRTGVYTGHTGPIIQLLVLGDYLISLGADKQLLVRTIGSDRDTPKFRVTLPGTLTPTCMAHPDTYLNKLIVGTANGQLLLINFSTGNVLYTFQGWGSAVKYVTSSPALDVVGVALADGRAVLHNLKFDETVVSFANAAGTGLASGLLLGGSSSAAASVAAAAAGAAGAGVGACTCLAFKTGAGAPLMAAGGGTGAITLWDLENRRLHSVVQDAHDAPVVALHFFAGEPLLMSAGADNAVKHWVLDNADQKPRLLRFRSGHAAPPTIVQHYGEGLRLLSAGSDRAFRVFSTIQDQQSRELSQKHTSRRAKKLKIRESEIKLGRVTCLDTCTVRERDWANVLTGHENDDTAYVWRLAHFTLGEHELRPPGVKETTQSRRGAAQQPPGGQTGGAVTSVCISACGNYGLVGSAYGRLDRYNMQSGMHRAVYARKKSGQDQALLSAHDGPVTGVRVDSCNKLMVTVGLDGYLRIWDFKKHTVRCEVSVGCPATQLVLGSGSGFAAVACDDHTVRCYDIEAGGRLVRRFKGHRDRITCIQLSADNRWLLTASMDGTLRAWDIPAAQCIQVLRLGAPVTSFSLSPVQDLLATCHVNRRGIYLWSNQSVFGNPADFTPGNEQVVDAVLPSIAEGASTATEGSESDATAITTVSQLLSGVGLLLSDDEDEMVGYEINESESEDPGQQEGADAAGVPTDTDTDRNVPTGTAPTPLAPSLVTLSLLPRAQWHSLLHLETIKARNKPIEPPKKPEAAPFFLPTVPTLARNPVFDTNATNTHTNDNNTDAAGHEEGAEEGPAGGSRILRSAAHAGDAGGAGGAGGLGGHVNAFLRLLRAGQDARDWTSFFGYIRELSPTALDREVRALQMLTDVNDTSALAQEAVSDLSSLLEAVESELGQGTNFEFASALLQLVLQVHGDTIMERPELQSAASRVQKRLKPTWKRLDTLLSDVRCMTAFFGSLQG